MGGDRCEYDMYNNVHRARTHFSLPFFFLHRELDR